jgi:hypothetical protein
MIESESAFLAGYGSAIVRFATCRPGNKKAQPALLVFASLEFVHCDRPAPDSTPLDGKGIPPKTQSRGPSRSQVYFRRVAMGAPDALAWYRQAIDGKVTSPLAADPADHGPHDGGPLRTPLLLEEPPPWPQLAFPISDHSLLAGESYYPTPFMGPGASPARIRRLMSAADPDLEVLTQDLAVCSWLASRIHFRIDDYPELLGSIVLVAPDPQVRSVKQFLTRDKDQKERLITLLQPRTGQNLQGLELTILEERFGAISTFLRLPIPSHGVIVTEAPAQIRSSGYMLAHPERGLIDFQPPLPFLRTVGIRTETLSQRVRLQTRDSKKKDAEVKTHEIDQFEPAADSVVGDVTPPMTPHARYYDAVERRRISRHARLHDQRWINDVASARAFLRSTIGDARQEVFVADSFFSGEELSGYLHFVRRLNVHLKVLTSRDAFGNTQERPRALALIKQNLTTFLRRGFTNVDVRVMRNKEGDPILHDRFLVVDGAVWFSGNSFNAIGQRESMIVKLPNPAPVIKRLDELFEVESDDLADFSDLGEA